MPTSSFGKTYYAMHEFLIAGHSIIAPTMKLAYAFYREFLTNL